MSPTDTIGIRAHGVELNLSAEFEPLLRYTASLVPELVGPPCPSPALTVRAHWIHEPRKRGRSWFPEAPDDTSSGPRLRLGEDELLWVRMPRDRDLQLRARREGDRTAFDVACRYWPSAKKRAEYPDLERKRYYDLLRYLVHFPIAWHLERTRGWSLLHASAVCYDGGAVLVAGPGGSGKTTTSLALLCGTSATPIAENLVLCDGKVVYPVQEPLRLGEEALALLGPESRYLEERRIESGLKHKQMFHLPPSVEGGTPVQGVFLAQFATRTVAEPLAAPVACELLEAGNRLALELSDYTWYTAALGLLWPRPGSFAKRIEVAERLTSGTPCWNLGIDRSAGVKPVVDTILGCLKRTKGCP